MQNVHPIQLLQVCKELQKIQAYVPVLSQAYNGENKVLNTNILVYNLLRSVDCFDTSGDVQTTTAIC